HFLRRSKWRKSRSSIRMSGLRCTPRQGGGFPMSCRTDRASATASSILAAPVGTTCSSVSNIAARNSASFFCPSARAPVKASPMPKRATHAKTSSDFWTCQIASRCTMVWPREKLAVPITQGNPVLSSFLVVHRAQLTLLSALSSWLLLFSGQAFASDKVCRSLEQRYEQIERDASSIEINNTLFSAAEKGC